MAAAGMDVEFWSDDNVRQSRRIACDDIIDLDKRLQSLTDRETAVHQHYDVIITSLLLFNPT